MRKFRVITLVGNAPVEVNVEGDQAFVNTGEHGFFLEIDKGGVMIAAFFDWKYFLEITKDA